MSRFKAKNKLERDLLEVVKYLQIDTETRGSLFDLLERIKKENEMNIQAAKELNELLFLITQIPNDLEQIEFEKVPYQEVLKNVVKLFIELLPPEDE